MRRVQLFIASSLDGYIARKDGAIDWLFHDGDYGYRRFMRGIDTVVMGRKTYDLSLSFGPWPYPGCRAYVFSRRLTGETEHATFVRGDVKKLVQKMRRRRGKHIWLVGGAELTREFTAAGLIDDFIISVHPRLIGSGIPLFPPNSADWSLRLVGARRYRSGLVQLRYERAAT
ncbi:MAG TPA: dihydrofolate reductase family protein [Planctomycetota bacterium]|nr:dihydrofolate reductase family protein [Planctomycetota bacterium]